MDCKKCDKIFANNDEYLLHLDNHREIEFVQRTKDISQKCEGQCEDVKGLNEELKSYKNNFQRLETLLKESIEEQSQIRSQNEARIITANDRIEELKAENVELKDKNDILYQLGRSYIERNDFQKPSQSVQRKPNPQQSINQAVEDAQSLGACALNPLHNSMDNLWRML